MIFLFDTLRRCTYTPFPSSRHGASMSNQAAVSQRIQVGDTVALTQSFTDRHGLPSGGMTLISGKVTAIHRIAENVIMADIAWNSPGLSKRLDAKNLIKVAR
jgi:hypothetical protein